MKYPLLDTIDSPEDVQALTMPELKQLTHEVRARIIDVMSEKGGHLASNLGSVELICAMHYVFNSPDDKMIYDTAHQTYPHKILTGRNKQFSSIRQYKGLCGFTDPLESPHDHFHSGHAGTALSLAVGAMHSRDLNNEDHYIIPFLGDASFTCGLTFEALNNIKSKAKKFILILNDNAMAISENVGAMTHICSRLVNNPITHHLYNEIETMLEKIPGYGDLIARKGRKVKDSLTQLISPAQENLFAQFGFNYIGPVDGHDVEKLVDTFQAIKESDDNRPIVIHALTNKGQGMDKAIANPITYHGVKPFDPETGDFLQKGGTSKPTFPAIFGKEMLALSENDPSVVTITPAMSKGSCLDELRKKYPKRCIDVGIAEGHCVTFAGGLTYGGKNKVVACIYATFLQRAFDNVFHDVCLQELPVVFALDRSGIAGGDGVTHNGIYDIAFLQSMPNMVIAQPRNGHLLKELLHSSFSWGKPCAIRYPNLPTEAPSGKVNKRELGRSELLIKGKDLLIIALGHMCQAAMDVRERLLAYGIEATILDPVFVKPLDEETLRKLFFTHHQVVTLEEHSVIGGLGSAINHFIIKEDYKELSVYNIGIPDCFVAHGSREQLLTEHHLDVEQITKRILLHYDIKSPQPSKSLK